MAAVRSSLPVKVRYHAWAVPEWSPYVGHRVTALALCAGRPGGRSVRSLGDALVRGPRSAAVVGCGNDERVRPAPPATRDS